MHSSRVSVVAAAEAARPVASTTRPNPAPRLLTQVKEEKSADGKRKSVGMASSAAAVAARAATAMKRVERDSMAYGNRA